MYYLLVYTLKSLFVFDIFTWSIFRISTFHLTYITFFYDDIPELSSDLYRPFSVT